MNRDDNAHYYETQVEYDADGELPPMHRKRLPRDHPGSRWPRPQRDWAVEHEVVRTVSKDRLLRLRREWDRLEKESDNRKTQDQQH